MGFQRQLKTSIVWICFFFPKCISLCFGGTTLVLFCFFVFFFSFFWLCHAAWRILIPPPGIKPAGPPAVEVQGPKHWTTWKVLFVIFEAKCLFIYWPFTRLLFKLPIHVGCAFSFKKGGSFLSALFFLKREAVLYLIFSEKLNLKILTFCYSGSKCFS